MKIPVTLYYYSPISIKICLSNFTLVDTDYTADRSADCSQQSCKVVAAVVASNYAVVESVLDFEENDIAVADCTNCRGLVDLTIDSTKTILTK